MAKKQLGEQFGLLHVTVHHKGKPRQELMTGTWSPAGTQLLDLPSVAYSACSFMLSGTRVARRPAVWVLPH